MEAHSRSMALGERCAVKRRRVIFREMFLRPDNPAVPHLKEGHREQGGFAVADLRHGRRGVGALVESPDGAAPVARPALVESDEVPGAADALLCQGFRHRRS